MKKIILSIIALVSVSSLAFAGGRPTGLSISGGPSYKYYYGKYDGKKEKIIDYYGGDIEVGYNLNFLNLSSVYFGARAIIGAHSDVDNHEVGKVKTTTAVSNIVSDLEIPIKYQINLNRNTNGDMDFFFNVGPTFAAMLTNTTSGYSLIETDGKITKSETEPINNFKDTDNIYNRAGLMIGGSLGMLIHHVKIQLSYDHLVTNFIKDLPKGQGALGGEARISVGYQF